ncbi:MAG: flagellin [Limisphaerales bacterium]|nr:MAG: flagellin [Limisphaerales bacterium]
MVINTNIQAQSAARNLQESQGMLGKSLARLSSGSKITNPADDAAGLAVSLKLDAQANRLAAARYNLGNAISLTQAQDGLLQKVGRALDRMGELAILGQDVTKTDTDRALYQSEFSQLASFIGSTATKEFNGVSLFSSSALNITIDSEGNTFSMSGINLGAASYTGATGASVASSVSSAAALTSVKSAITQLASDRSSIGAFQSRLNSTAEQLAISRENLTAASSRIKDVDVADESTAYARYNILVQSGTAMLAQANQLPQNVLRLLQ